jgi:hypothetical protein
VGKAGILKLSSEVSKDFDPILRALGPVRQALNTVADVVTVRPGYHYPEKGEPVPAIVVAVTPGTTPVSVTKLAHEYRVPFRVTDATVEEQLAATKPKERPTAYSLAPAPTKSALETLLTGGGIIAFAAPKKGAYQPLKPPKLPLVNEKMKLTICVSPEAGWGELEVFLAGTTERLTVAMYQFTAPHIFKAVKQAVTPAGRTFELVLHPVPEKPPRSGVKAHDLNEKTGVLRPLSKLLKRRFAMSWATLKSNAHPDGLWASAYHIKVAVCDGSSVWLSSGNWQSSNQPDIHPFDKGSGQLPAGFQRKYNRDYHAIIDNQELAAAYEIYIKRDYELTKAQAGKAQAFILPELFVPVEEPDVALAFAHPMQLFPPLRLERRIKVQPLLTPDNYAGYALKLIKSAKTSVWFQNQYINFRGTSEDFAEFRLLIEALKTKIAAGLDVRIICRDMMKEESMDVLIALGFPRDLMRFQPACHNKTIIVDGQVVMFGSHNWSNEGVSTNRDASLIFFDKEIAAYLATVYEYDWNNLATAKPTAKRPRVAKPGEKTPHGYRRVAFSEVFED